MNFFDLHCDTATLMYEKRYKLHNNSLHINLLKSNVFEKYIQVFSIFVPDKFYKTKNGFEYFENVFKYLNNEININKNIVNLINDKSDFICTNLKNSIILSIESSNALDGNIKNFYKAKNYGVKSIVLTWNGESYVSYGIDSHYGLKPFGKLLINEMEKNNVIIDVSHASDILFYDILNNTTKPLIASHSNARDIFFCKRNLSLDIILEIKRRKGLIGLNFYKNFLYEGKGDSFLSIMTQIDYFLSYGCENILCIGSDFDGSEIDSKLNSLEKVKYLYNFLIIKGYKKEILNKIFFENAYNFYEKFYN